MNLLSWKRQELQWLEQFKVFFCYDTEYSVGYSDYNNLKSFFCHDTEYSVG